MPIRHERRERGIKRNRRVARLTAVWAMILSVAAAPACYRGDKFSYIVMLACAAVMILASAIFENAASTLEAADRGS